ncbi:UDP-xylose transporter 1 [Ancistrocladus abbreviatus]
MLTLILKPQKHPTPQNLSLSLSLSLHQKRERLRAAAAAAAWIILPFEGNCISVLSKMGEAPSFQLGVVGALFLSVASSVSIVICNKALMSNLGFPFATTLTSWHLMVTFCALHVAQRLDFFETKSVDMKTVMLFGILNGVSIGLLNLSLGFNSIGFYQMTKLAIIPFTVLLETVFLKKQFSRKIRLSLFILLIGVGIASVTDLQLNFVGSILSILAIITTCIGQILTNTIQKRLNVSSTQLLYQSAPFQAAILFVSGPLVDQCLTHQSVFAYKYTPIVLGFIILSCVISISVNFSTFLVIGKTSPVTYQVLGHLKTCLVLAFGYTLLHDPFTHRNIIGITIAVFGMALYSYFCTNDNKKKTLPDLSSQIREKESSPLLSGKNAGQQEKEGLEVKKSAAKDSV